MTELLGLAAFGLILGIKHAIEADHVAAVSTFVSQTKSLSKATQAGALWGVGHTATLLAVGGLILLLKVSVPEKVALGLELPVGILLIYMGFRLIIKARKSKMHVHAHEHGGGRHVHMHSHKTSNTHRHTHQSFWMGMVHGLAGSAALMLLVLSTTTSPWQGLGFILVFGIGSVVGMLIISTLIGVPFLLSHRFERLESRLQQTTGAISSLAGLLVLYQLLIVERLFG